MIVTNTTATTLYAPQVEGVDYTAEPGGTLDVEARTALLLGEYGFTVADELEAITTQEPPFTEGRDPAHTGGEMARLDDARVNVAGTPLEETGDTGSPTNERAEELGGADVPGVPATKGKGRRIANDPATQPPVEPGTQADASSPLSAAAALLDVSSPISTGEDWTSVERQAWVDTLKGQALDDVMANAGLSSAGLAVVQKRQLLSAWLTQNPATTKAQLTGDDA